MQTAQARTTTVLETLERAWSHGEVDGLDTILHPAYVRRGRRSEYTLAELKATIADMRRAFPDLSMTVERAIDDGDNLAMYWRSTGTLTDHYLGLPPTGRQFSVTGATFARFDGDLIVEESVVYDRRGEYESLGVSLGQGAKHGGGSADTSVDATPEAVRALHRQLVTGVTVVAAASEDGPRGLAVNAFSSVSLEPPLILICVQKNSSTYAHLIASEYFSVNVLAADQLHVAKVFATKQPRKFDAVSWHEGKHGTPMVDGASARMEVRLQDTLHASTHTIFIGRVVDVFSGGPAPLVYTDGQFFDGRALRPAEDTDA